jgi:hypothetical protein
MLKNKLGHRALLDAAKVVAASRKSWSMWVEIVGPALLLARREAMRIAETEQPIGAAYARAMSSLLDEYHLHLSETARAHLLKIMTHLADVEAWRSKQPDADEFSNPTTVWLRFQKSSQMTDTKTKNRKKRLTNGNYAAALEEIELLKTENAKLKAELERLKSR